MSRTRISSPSVLIVSIAVGVWMTSPASGVELVYATYLGGSASEGPAKVGVGAGLVHIAGHTWSGDFPGRGGTPTLSPTLAYLLALDPAGDGALDHQWTRFLTGSFTGDLDGDSSAWPVSGVAVNATGIYVVGFTGSTDFGTTDGSQPLGERDIFLVKLDLQGSLRYATLFGGTDNDYAFDVAVDESGVVYVTGHTASTDFPDGAGGTLALTGGTDVIVARVESLPGSPYELPTFTAVSLSGEKNDTGRAIALRGSRVYVSGITASSGFQTVNARFPASGGRDDAFVAGLGVDLELEFSTYLGGGGDDAGADLAVDDAAVYVTGTTGSSDFPAADMPSAAPFQQEKARNDDAFVVAFTLDGSAVTYSTFLGGSRVESGDGIALDSLGNIVVAGSTGSGQLPDLGRCPLTRPTTVRKTFS